MDAREATFVYLKKTIGEDMGKDFGSFLASWGDDETIIFGQHGRTVAGHLVCEWPGEKNGSSRRPYVLSNVGLYVFQSEKTGWRSSRKSMRLIPKGEIAGCRKKSEHIGGVWVKRLFVLDSDNREIVQLASYGDSADRIADLAQALGFEYSDRLGF